jgi:uncharacterized protein YlxW (UPF0749 family)
VTGPRFLPASLLASLLDDPLDPGYRAVATTPPDPPALRRTASAGRYLVLALIGVVLAAAYHQTVAHAPEASKTRSRLVKEVRDRTASTDALNGRVEAERKQVAEQRTRSLAATSAGRQAADDLRTLELLGGYTAVRGPGLTVRVADGPGKPGGDPEEGRVLDRDLQDLVNGLWQAGAEAVGVNGQRITPTTTIRQAGGAVLVDFRPVFNPYTITAVGDRNQLETAFTDSAVARRFRAWTQVYGMKFSVRSTGGLTLPAGTENPPRYATGGRP